MAALLRPDNLAGMAAQISFTAVYEQVENGWTQARIEQLPGVITAAPSLKEAKELLADALREYLLSLGEPAKAAPQGSVERGRVEVVIDAT